MPRIANVKLISWKQPRAEQLVTPRLGSWAVFRPVAASSNPSAPGPGHQPPQPDSLLLFRRLSFPIRVTSNFFFFFFFPNAVLLRASTLNRLGGWSNNNNVLAIIKELPCKSCGLRYVFRVLYHTTTYARSFQILTFFKKADFIC